MNDAIITVTWLDDAQVLSTRVAGVLSLDDVERWRQDLQRTVRRLPREGVFRMLVDVRGYEVADQNRHVHQVMREVIPLFLAAHGFRVGFFDLYQAEPSVGRDAAEALCVAAAHVHHDQAKMERYNELLGTTSERFFSDLAEAAAWLQHTPAVSA